MPKKCESSKVTNFFRDDAQMYCDAKRRPRVRQASPTSARGGRANGLTHCSRGSLNLSILYIKVGEVGDFGSKVGDFPPTE